MLAYHNDVSVKNGALAKMAGHRKADELVQGYGYWSDGKGCAVGCLIESSDHIKYETLFGVPVMLAQLEDAIFEGLPQEQARLWPERFLGAIQVGSDLSKVGWLFLGDMLRKIQIPDSADPDVQACVLASRASVVECAELMDLYASGKTDESAARSAARSSWSAARSSWSAAESAAESARSAARSSWSAARSSWSAAESAAESARSAARSARSAAESAAESARSARSARSAAESAAESARSARSARSAAESAAYVEMSDILIQRISEAPIPEVK